MLRDGSKPGREDDGPLPGLRHAMHSELVLFRVVFKTFRIQVR